VQEVQNIGKRIKVKEKNRAEGKGTKRVPGIGPILSQAVE